MNGEHILEEQFLSGWTHFSDNEKRKLFSEIAANKPSMSPYYMEIHPTNRCNLDCFFCSAKSHRNNEELSFETLKKIITEGATKNLRSIRLSGGGESLIYSNIEPFLVLLKDTGTTITDLTTNGVALNKHAKLLLDIGVDYLCVSLNEPCSELYSKSLGVKEEIFHKAVESVKVFQELNKLGNQERRTVLRIKFFLWKNNFRHIERMLSLGSELGADKIQLNTISNLSNTHRMSDSELTETKEILQTIIRSDSALENKLEFNLREEKGLHEFVESCLAENSIKSNIGCDGFCNARYDYCMMGWMGCALNAAGNVYPCCNFVGVKDKIMGNANSSDFNDIWIGEKYKVFRREFRDLMLLRGKMEYSAKFHKYITPYCISSMACPFAYYLFPQRCYLEIMDMFQNKCGKSELVIAKAKNFALSSVHKLKHYIK